VFVAFFHNHKENLGRKVLNFGAYVKIFVLVKKLPPQNGARGGAVC